MSARLDQIEKILLEISINQKKTDERLAKMDAHIAKLEKPQLKTDAQLAKTDAQLARTDKQLEQTKKILTHLGVHVGAGVEEYYYNSLKEKKALGSIRFDYIQRNLHRKTKAIEGEYDIVLINGKYVALIECKHKLKETDIDNMIDKQVKNFRILFPYYKNHKIVLAFGATSFFNDAELYAQERGLALLKMKGEVVMMQDKNLQVY